MQELENNSLRINIKERKNFGQRKKRNKGN